MRKIALTSWSIAKKTAVNFFKGDSFSYASSIAFSTIFSLPSILIIALSIGATFYERDIVQTELMNQVGSLIGKDSALEIEKIIQNAAFDMSSFLARAIGIGTLIFSATTVFMALQSSLNSMWNIKSKTQ